MYVREKENDDLFVSNQKNYSSSMKSYPQLNKQINNLTASGLWEFT